MRRSPVYAQQGASKVHVVRYGHENVAWCGAELHGDEYLARMVPLVERCNAAPCRTHWPANLRAVG